MIAFRAPPSRTGGAHLFAALVYILHAALAQGAAVRYHGGKQLSLAALIYTKKGGLPVSSVGLRNDIQSFPGKPFALPKDERFFSMQFWTISKAASEWGCTYQCARRWVLLHPELAVLVRVWSPRSPVPRWKLCVFAGQQKISRSEGAAHFRSSAWQRSMANRRWRRQRGDGEPPRSKELPTPHYGRCRQPIPGSNFPNTVKDQRQQLHRWSPEERAEALRILRSPVRVKGW